ncbi:P12 family lipoprotein [Borreliella turdi]|uniref:P12 family lipoprotein n=1 Tax=Borreliella turdi TaxID=57863 RepID=UPI00399C63DA
MKEKKLVSSTNEEKKAEKSISNVKNVLKDLEFTELVGDVHKLKNEFKQLKTSFPNIPETMGIKKEIKELIQEAKFVLVNFKK